MTPLTEARSRLSEIVDEVASTGSAVEISRHGRPVAVVRRWLIVLPAGG